MVYAYIRFFITFTFSLLLTGFLLNKYVETNCDYKMVDKGVKSYFGNCSPSDTTSST